MSPKAALRRQLRERRDALEGRARKSAAIQEAVARLPLWERAPQALLYVSFGSEVGTHGLFLLALAQGKAVFVPRCLDGEGRMAFFQVRSREDLAPGRFGLWEPKPGCPPWEGRPEALCLVPGLSFDREGYRLGYGKGYYDRFLAAFPGKAVGLCYEELTLPRLPRSPLDQRVGWLVTEAGAERKVLDEP